MQEKDKGHKARMDRKNRNQHIRIPGNPERGTIGHNTFSHFWGGAEVI